jgi:cyclopropane-fatty-acyl-phospholipid synthase
VAVATQAEVEVSYDVGNDFFQLWLDRRMNYSCAVWANGDDLDRAQTRKLDFLHDLARTDQHSRVLDIGCGWGANLERLVESRSVAAAEGITLSPAQATEIRARRLPRTQVHLVDYRDFAPVQPFDAAVSIEMFEHIATPAQAARGQHMAVFRDYFRRVHDWTRPNAWFALHTITITKLPRRSDHIRDMAVATRTVLPGSRCARLDEIVQACSATWEVMSVATRRQDYVRTCEEWLRRLRANKETIRSRWGDRTYDEYDHYLRSCVWAFDLGYLSIAQLALRRINR